MIDENDERRFLQPGPGLFDDEDDDPLDPHPDPTGTPIQFRSPPIENPPTHVYLVLVDDTIIGAFTSEFDADTVARNLSGIDLSTRVVQTEVIGK